MPLRSSTKCGSRGSINLEKHILWSHRPGSKYYVQINSSTNYEQKSWLSLSHVVGMHKHSREDYETSILCCLHACREKTQNTVDDNTVKQLHLFRHVDWKKLASCIMNPDREYVLAHLYLDLDPDREDVLTHFYIDSDSKNYCERSHPVLRHGPY